MKYIASWSGGKDSTAMLIKIKELNMPLDEVIYCEIKYDDKISGEMPEMAEFIVKAEKILLEKFGIKVKHLTAHKTFKEFFYTRKEKGNHNGRLYGFPYTVGAWCNDRLKVGVINRYFRQMRKSKTPFKQYIGIAYDEPKRYARLDHENEIAPLYDLKINEADTYEICRKYDLLSPTYESSTRGGCWFCPKQSIGQCKRLWKEYPHLWNELKTIENDSFNTFKPNYTIQELEDKFIKEENSIETYINKNQISLF